jgi:hypothetical protein
MEYHEIYGYLPTEVIEKIPEFDRKKLFLNWVFRKPTETGWFITRAVIAELGDEFIEYLIDSIIEGMTLDGEEVTRDDVLDELRGILEMFATDVNILYESVKTFLEESDQDSDEDSETPVKDNLPPRDSRGRFVKQK